MKNKKQQKRPSRARKTSTVPTKVYAYGALPPRDAVQQALVGDQVFAAHRYRNKLIEIERGRRENYRNLRLALSPELKALEVQYAEANEAYLAARHRLHAVLKKDRSTSPIVEEVRALSQARKPIWKAVQKARAMVEKKHFKVGDGLFKRLKKARLAAWAKAHPGKRIGPWISKKLNTALHEKLTMGRASADMLAWRRKKKADELAHLATLKAREEAGCFPGVYLAVEKAARQSFDNTKFQPAFMPFDHRGAVGAQITGHVTVADAMAGRSTKIKIELLPDVKIAGMNRGRTAAVAHLCLGQHRTTGAMTYLDIPFVMHRPLPADGVLKWVYLAVKRVGVRSVYELQFTVESETFRLHRENHPGGALAVNHGWRRMPDGSIRVATTWDGAEHTEVCLPGILYARQCYAEDLIGKADDHFNTAREILKTWLSAKPKPKLPAKLVTSLKLASIAHWRQPGRLASAAFALRDLYLPGVDVQQLWCRWRDERIAPCPEGTKHRAWVRIRPPKLNLFDTYANIAAWAAANGVTEPRGQLALYLEWWRRKDKHLRGVARDILLNIVRHRREVYRCKAREWATKYKTILVEQWDKSVTAETPLPEHDLRTPQEEAASRLRQIAGVSYLTGSIKQAVGPDMIERASKDITRVHAGGCRGVLDGKAGPTVDVVCTGCGRMYDQDVNAARNLWESYDSERRGGGGPTGPARNVGTTNDPHEVAAE